MQPHDVGGRRVGLGKVWRQGQVTWGGTVAVVRSEVGCLGLILLLRSRKEQEQQEEKERLIHTIYLVP